MRRAGIGLLAALLGLAAAGQLGCKSPAYCFSCGDEASGGGGNGQGGNGQGGNGVGGGLFGSGGGGGQSCDADLMTDPQNCGTCGTVCELPNAFPACEGGFCVIADCAVGWVDLDAAVANGCEYACAPSNGGAEICDGADNDCNGLTDELTSLQTDPFNCGACNSVCAYANAQPLCQAGACAMGDCFVGYHDANLSDADGCEYPCTVTNGGVEICDLTDNDCDAAIDEGIDLMTDTANCGSCGVSCGAQFPNTVPVCDQGACELGPCLQGYVDLDGLAQNGCEYACAPSNGGVEICDGVDNDCNGLADEGALPGVGTPCGATDVGECAFGVRQCLAGALTCVGEVTATAELCDGLDNDCDNASDEGCPVAQASDQRLDAGAGSAVGQAPSTQLSAASRGDLLLAAYLDRRAGTADIFANISQNGGQSWGAADLTVAAAADLEVEPAAAVGLSGAYVAYGRFNGNQRDVWLARAAAPYTSFTGVRADKTAGNVDAFFIRAAVAVPGSPDAIVVVWQSLSGVGANVTTDVWIQRSLDGGQTWNAGDLRVNAVQGVAELPVLATDGAGRAFIAWRDQRAGNAEVYVDTYSVATGALSGNLPVSGGEAGEGIVIAADEGGPNVYVAWTDLRAAKKAIRVARSINSGASFTGDGAIVNPDSTFADAQAPAIAARAGRVVVAWEDTRSGQPDVRVNRSVNAGASWLAATSRVDLGSVAGTGASTTPSVAFGAGDTVYVTWADARSGQRDIYANLSFDQGVTFQPNDLRLDVGSAGAPSPPGGADSRDPRMLTNAGGARGVVVWIDNRTTAGVTGVNADIYSSWFQ